MVRRLRPGPPRAGLLSVVGLLVSVTGAGAVPGTASAADPSAGPTAPELELAGASAAGTNPTLAILVLTSEEAEVPLSEIYTRVRAVIEAHTAVNVAPLDLLGLAEREAAIRDCAGRGACFASRVRASASNVGLLLTISIDRLDEGLLLGLRLVDVRSEREIGASGDELPVGMSLSGALEQQLPEVFPRSIWDQVAALVVTTEPSNAEVSIAGRSCASPCELARLMPGTYELTARKAGHLPWQQLVTLVAQRPVTVKAALEEQAASLSDSPLFWGALGLSAIGAGLASFFLLRPANEVVTLCVTNDPSSCK
jgi:hypothetical protein